MIAVLDASAAVEIVLQRKMAAQLNDCLDEAEWVIAPTLFISEVTNVFWKYQRLADFPFQFCEQRLDLAIALPDDFIEELDLFREAFKMACTLNHPVYGMLYLVVARRKNATLLTLDRKLVKAAQKSSIDVAILT